MTVGERSHPDIAYTDAFADDIRRLMLPDPHPVDQPAFVLGLFTMAQSIAALVRVTFPCKEFMGFKVCSLTDDIIFDFQQPFGTFAHILRNLFSNIFCQPYMVFMPMSVEHGFMLLLILRQYPRHHLRVLFRSRRLSTARQVLTEVNEYPGSISRDFGNTTTYLLKSSVYRYFHRHVCKQ